MGGNSRRVVAQPLVRLSGDYPEAIMLDLVRCPDWLEAMLEAGRTVQPVIANFYDWGATSRQKAMHLLGRDVPFIENFTRAMQLVCASPMS